MWTPWPKPTLSFSGRRTSKRSGSSNTTGVWIRLFTASDCAVSTFTRKLGRMLGARASASRPIQPNSSPLFGVAVTFCTLPAGKKLPLAGVTVPFGPATVVN